MEDKRHIIGVRLNERMMGVLFREGATMRCMSGVPADAVFLGVSADFQSRSIIAYFEHPSFPICPDGAEPRWQSVAFEIIEHPSAPLHDQYPVQFDSDGRVTIAQVVR